MDSIIIPAILVCLRSCTAIPTSSTCLVSFIVGTLDRHIPTNLLETEQDKISEKAGLLVYKQDIFKNSMTIAKIVKLRGKTVHNNAVKK